MRTLISRHKLGLKYTGEGVRGEERGESLISQSGNLRVTPTMCRGGVGLLMKKLIQSFHLK